MTENYFQLKYDTVDNFYIALACENYSVEEAIEFTYYRMLGGHAIETIKDVVVAIELIGLQVRHLGKDSYNDKEELRKIISLNYKLDIEEELREEELSSYLETFGYISNMYTEVTGKNIQ